MDEWDFVENPLDLALQEDLVDWSENPNPLDLALQEDLVDWSENPNPLDLALQEDLVDWSENPNPLDLALQEDLVDWSENPNPLDLALQEDLVDWSQNPNPLDLALQEDLVDWSEKPDPLDLALQEDLVDWSEKPDPLDLALQEDLVDWSGEADPPDSVADTGLVDWLTALDIQPRKIRLLGLPKKKAKTMPSAYSKLKSSKKAEALDLLQATAKKGYGKQFLDLAYVHGVPLAEKGKGGHSAVHLVAGNGHVQLMKDLLIKELPQIDMAQVLQDGLFRERLQRAELHRDLFTLKLGKFVKNKSKYGWRPLHFAIKACAAQPEGNKGLEMVALLLLIQGDSGMQATQKRERVKGDGEEKTKNKSGGESPIHIAAKSGSVRVLELIWQWCDVFGKEVKFELFVESDEKSWTALHHAVANNQGKAVEWLLERQRRDQTKLDVDAKSEKGYTALMTAAGYSQNEMCRLLLREDIKADCTCAAADGLTALHLAAMHDNKELVDLLLSHGASCKAQDKHGNTPLHIARKKYCFEAAKALEDHDKTLLEVENKDGYTPANIPTEDKEYIPPEIRKRGKEAIRVYEEALKDGRTQIPHVKFVLLGEAGHGKTSLLRLLEGEEFVPDGNSTEGIECDLVSSKTLDGTNESAWKKNDRPNYIDALAGYLGKYLPEPEVAAVAKQKTPWDDLTEAGADQHIAKLFRPTPPRVVVPHSGRPAQPLPVFLPSHDVLVSEAHSPREASNLHYPSFQPPLRSPQRVQPAPPRPAVDREHPRRQQQQQRREAPVQSLPQSPEVPDPDDMEEQLDETSDPPRPARMLSTPSTGRALDRALKDRAKQMEKPKLTFTTYDFAGQDLYRPMHHCFITQRSVFVIVYNSQNYNKLRREKDESRFRYISYWFNTVSAYTEVMDDPDPKLEKKPPVFLVGTHRGPYDDEKEKGKKFFKLASDDEEAIQNDLERSYETEDCHDRYLRHLKGSVQELFCFVESSQAGKESGAPGLRRCLRDKAHSLPYMKDEYPVRWLQLEEKLKDRSLIPLAAVKEEAKAVGFPFPPSGGECKEFELAMKFLHDIGVIAYPCELPRVFLSDEEVEKVKEVVLCGPQHLPNMMKEVMLLEKYHLGHLPHDDHRIFTQKQVATENTLRVVLKKFLDPNAEDESLQYLCLLLRAYGLIFKVEVGGSDEGQQSPPQYLVPCKLKAMRPDDFPKPGRESFSFVADFQGYLPQEVFTRFACWAALKAKASVLRPKKGKTKCHLMQNFCSVKHLMVKGDAWFIRCDMISSKMVFDVSVPHQFDGDLADFVCYASNGLHQLCKDLKLHGLLYQVGKDFRCKECSEEDFFEVSSHEQGAEPKVTLEVECDCACAVSINELLQQDLEQTNDKLRATPTEEHLRKYICKEVVVEWEEVCTYLGILRNKRQEIKNNNPLNTKEAFFQCLMYWADGNTDKDTTWLALLEALEEANLKGVATPLKKRILNDRL